MSQYLTQSSVVSRSTRTSRRSGDSSPKLSLPSPKSSRFFGSPRSPKLSASTTNVASRQWSVGLQETRNYSRPSFFAAEKTSAVRKINDGDFDDLTIKDIQFLFEIIDVDRNEMIDFSEISRFLREVLDPPCSEHEIQAIYNLTDMNADGTVSAEEIFNALTSGPVKNHLLQLQGEEQVRRRFNEMQGLTAEVDRDLLFEKVKWRVLRDDAFRTLPFTTCYIVVFTCVAASHLQIWQRQQVERGLEAWILGYGKELVGPFLKQAVGNVASTGFWLQESGLASVFGECRDNSAGLPFCHLATRNVLVGDVCLSQLRKDGSTLQEWLLHDSPQVQSHLTLRPRDFLNASVLRVHHLWDTRWANEDTEEVKLSFSTYNRRARMFAVTEVIVRYGHGFVVPSVVAAAAIMDPYPSKAYFALDALYCCLLLYPLFAELKDLVTTCRLQGMVEGCRTYWDFWNTIDWLSILIGCTGIIVWVFCCLAMEDPSLRSLLAEDVKTQTLAPDVMQLDAQAVSQVKDALGKVIWLFLWLHVVLAINAVTIMLKFFKAFQANPRLQLVTDTFARAGDDMFHWAVVFSSIFVGFALSGNILFGGDLIQFNSVGASINTAFRTLMGEFDWYIDEAASDLGLGSGMPKEMLGLWFWGFMVLVTLILLNMLLAIILEHYAQLLMQLRNQEVPSIFTQTWGYVQQHRQEKGFVPLSDVLALLEDEDNPAHPDFIVTPESLMKAFTMKDEQAELLMDWLQAEAVERQKKEEGGDDSFAVRIETIEGFAEAMFDQLRVVCLNVSSLVARLDSMPGSPGKVARLDSMPGSPGKAKRGQESRMATPNKILVGQIASGASNDRDSRATPDSLSQGVSGSGNDRDSRALPHSRSKISQSAWGQSLGVSAEQLGQQVAKQKGAVQDISSLASQLRSLASHLELQKSANVVPVAPEQAAVLPSCLRSHCAGRAASARPSSAPPCKGRSSGGSSSG